jgi:hypothetical protein
MNALTKATVALASASALAVSAIATSGPASAAPKKPKASISSVTVDEGAGQATVTVTLNKKAKKRLKLNWSTQASPKSAKPGKDFTAVKHGRVVLKPGEKSAELVVPIIDDTEVEGTEFFFVKFNGKAVKVKNPRVRVTITDNDSATPAPTV